MIFQATLAGEAFFFYILLLLLSSLALWLAGSPRLQLWCAVSPASAEAEQQRSAAWLVKC